MKCSHAWNVREFRDFRGFANISCTRIFAPCSQLPVSFWIFQIGALLREIWHKTHSKVWSDIDIRLCMSHMHVYMHKLLLTLWAVQDTLGPTHSATESFHTFVTCIVNNSSYTCSHSQNRAGEGDLFQQFSSNFLKNGPIYKPKPPLESWKAPLFENSRNFHAREPPGPQIREILMSRNFHVLQYSVSFPL